MTLAIHHALGTSERATQFMCRFQSAPRPNAGCEPSSAAIWLVGNLPKQSTGLNWDIFCDPAMIVFGKGV